MDVWEYLHMTRCILRIDTLNRKLLENQCEKV
jgi:hypothetical protein